MTAKDNKYAVTVKLNHNKSAIRVTKNGFKYYLITLVRQWDKEDEITEANIYPQTDIFTHSVFEFAETELFKEIEYALDNGAYSKNSKGNPILNFVILGRILRRTVPFKYKLKEQVCSAVRFFVSMYNTEEEAFRQRVRYFAEPKKI